MTASPNSRVMRALENKGRVNWPQMWRCACNHVFVKIMNITTCRCFNAALPCCHHLRINASYTQARHHTFYEGTCVGFKGLLDNSSPDPCTIGDSVPNGSWQIRILTQMCMLRITRGFMRTTQYNKHRKPDTIQSQNGFREPTTET